MATALDVAAYILEKKGAMTTWKLQKLVYYCQAWSLVWDERELFEDRIEAWANGPVCRSLYDQHKRQFIVETVSGDPGSLDAEAQETIDAVLSYYGEKPSQWLSDLTHLEQPWIDARGDLPRKARSTAEITQDAMAAYYESLPADDD